MSSGNRKEPPALRILSIGNLQAKFGIAEAPRAWPVAVGWGVVITVVMLTFAVVVNIWIGRVIHWDWVAAFGTVSFLGLSIGRRARIL